MHTCVACVRTVYRYSCNDEADKNDSNTNYLHCTAVVEHIGGGGGGLCGGGLSGQLRRRKLQPSTSHNDLSLP